MKKMYSILAVLLLAAISFAQTPQKMSYQAIIRNNSGQLVTSHVVGIKISILQGSASGTVVSTETQTPTTNVNGLISIEIGGSTGFNAINWASGSYFIKTETDPTGGTNYSIVGTSQLLAVPYALHAKTVEIDNVNDADADPANEIQALSISGTNLTLSKGGGTVTLPPSGGGDNWGTQVVKTNASITGQGTDSSPLSVVSSVLSPAWTNILNIPAGFADGVDNVDDADHDITNEIQVLSISGSNLSLSNGGGTVVIPSTGGGGTSWSLTGNAGTNTTTDFIGTTNEMDIIFKRNNRNAGLLSTVNTSFGVKALNPLSTGSDNTAIGAGSLGENTLGSGNTAIGRSALTYNTLGNNNTAIGGRSLKSNSTGINNTAIGEGTLVNNHTGNGNTGCGYSTLSYNDASNNTANGSLALYLNNTGFSNVAMGSNSMYSNTIGSDNTAIGFESLNKNTTTNFNTAIGKSALYSNTSNFNTAIGYNSMYSNTTGSGNNANGAYSLWSNTTGSRNAASGMNSLQYNTTGSYNTANGYSSLGSNTTGEENTAYGSLSMYSNTIGGKNTANGTAALSSNTAGNNNTAGGCQGLQHNTTGNNNTADGYQALQDNTTGYQNTAIGYQTMQHNITGNNNTAIGIWAISNVTGSNNIGIGYDAQVPAASANNQIRLGNGSITYAGVQVAWTIGSDRRWKTDIKTSDLGLNFITKLKPVSYIRLNDESKKAEYGFIAQEVDETLKSVGATPNGIITIDDAGMYNLRYNDIIAPLVKAMQEQQQIIENLLLRIEKLENGKN
jgi:hypothetical protein